MNKAQVDRAANYFGVFRNPVGAQVLKDLKEAFNGSCYDPNAIAMAYNEGRRDVILYIEERIGEYVSIEDS